MLGWLGKMVAEKIIGVIVALLAIGVIVLIWRYHENLPGWAAVGRFLGSSLLWIVAVSLLPWISYPLVVLVQRAESNWPAAALLLGWSLLDSLLAWWLLDASAPAGVRWFFAGLAFCLGGLYNLIAANQIANRLQRH